MHTIDWYGNNGRSHPAPGTVETVACGVCGAEMNVERNVFGATSFAEAMAGGKHMHDTFTCPHVSEDWHKKVYDLKMGVYWAEVNEAPDYEQKKKVAEEEILKILEAHAAR